MAELHVVLDTNILVSGLAYPGSVPGHIISTWRCGGLKVSLSHYILDELVRVLPRLPRLNFTTTEIRDLVDSLMFECNIIEPQSARDSQLRDEADQPVLQTLLSANAQYLITGDKDLLVLSDRYPVISPAVFWQRHGT